MAKSSLRNLGRVAQQRKPEPPTVDLIVVTPIQNATVAAAVRALTPESDIFAVRDSLPEHLQDEFIEEAKIVAELSGFIQVLSMMGLPYGPGYIVKLLGLKRPLIFLSANYEPIDEGIRLKVEVGFVPQ